MYLRWGAVFQHHKHFTGFARKKLRPNEIFSDHCREVGIVPLFRDAHWDNHNAIGVSLFTAAELGGAICS
jgi:hypothetical protein